MILQFFFSRKLEVRADAVQASVDRAKATLDNESPNLIQLKCLSEEISDLNKFYTDCLLYTSDAADE